MGFNLIRRFQNKWKRDVIISLFFIVNLGCQSYRDQVFEIKQWISDGKFFEAESKLKELVALNDDNKLLYLMELGTVLQLSGKFTDSNTAFHQADRFADLQDYTSLSRETGAFIVAEELKQYKGEDFEVAMINALSALNYLSLQDTDGALVEIKRLNEKIRRYRDEADRKYLKNNSFAYFVSGLIWESQGQYDDSFLAMKAAYEANSGSRLLQESLLEIAKRAKRDAEYKKYSEIFDLDGAHQRANGKNDGEIVFIGLQGWIPEKNYRHDNFRFPSMYPLYSNVAQFEISVEGFSKTKADLLYSVEQTSIDSLEDQYSSYMLKKVSGVVAKAIIADQFRQKNEGLGDLVWIILNLTDRADLRQWSLLPGNLYAARLRLPEGKYKVNLSALGSDGSVIVESKDLESIKVEKGKKTYLMFRSLK